MLPLGMCVFLPHARGMPACLTNTIVAATSTVRSAARAAWQQRLRRPVLTAGHTDKDASLPAPFLSLWQQLENLL